MARISGGRNWRVRPAASITSPMTAVNRRSRIRAKVSSSVINSINPSGGSSPLAQSRSRYAAPRLFLSAWRDEVSWVACHERFDVVDELVGERLDRLAACPGDVRSQDEIRQAEQPHKRMILGRRLDRGYIEGGTGNPAGRQGLG